MVNIFRNLTQKNTNSLERQPLRIFFGHHKCATTWVIGLLYKIGDLTKLGHQHYDVYPYLNEQSISAKIISFTNADAAMSYSVPAKAKCFHLRRDPRDIIVSAYFSHLKTHGMEAWPELPEYRAQLQGLDIEDGLICVMSQLSALTARSHTANVFAQLEYWNYNNPDIMEIKFEDLVVDPVNVLTNVLINLGVCAPQSTADQETNLISAEELKNIIEGASFNKLTGGRVRGDEDTNSHYRKGVSGDWKNYFTSKVESYFQSRFPKLLERSGYQ